jgi:hypothetical protein
MIFFALQLLAVPYLKIVGGLLAAVDWRQADVPRS